MTSRTTPRHASLGIFAAIALVSVLAAPARATTPPAHAAAPATGVRPAAAHDTLRAHDERFATGHSAGHDYAHDRAALVKGQSPYAIILTCADSRVAPEIVFDETLGSLFVIRVAGNVVDEDVLGSIEYAAEHLHTRYLLVLGHDACGAVSAAVAGGEAPANVSALLAHIAPAVTRAKSKGLDEKGTVDAAVRENVRLQMGEVTHRSTLLAKLVHEHEFTIEGAVYHLDSGRVEWIAPAANATAGH